jgi:SAM-dependent methyltransferase
VSTLAASRAVRFAQKARAKGVRGICRSIAHRVRWDISEWLREQYWERRLGICTTGDESAEALGLPSRDCHGYGPSRYGSLRRIFDSLVVDPAADVFIDFGSGKGRVLAVAATYPFRKVIGVDPASQLNAIAHGNIGSARPWLRCSDIEIVAVDATSYAIPDTATVLYFANPFSGAVLSRVLDNVRASLGRAPRRITIISHNHDPSYDCERQIRSRSWLRLAAEIELQRHTRAWIYVS